MDDARIWAFEQSLWQASPEHYHERISDDCVAVVPTPPWIAVGQAWADLASQTPRWDEVAFSEQRVTRPHEGLIVIGYKVDAARGEEKYTAYCTSTMIRRAHDDWLVVEHQQTPPPVVGEKG